MRCRMSMRTSARHPQRQAAQTEEQSVVRVHPRGGQQVGSREAARARLMCGLERTKDLSASRRWGVFLSLSRDHSRGPFHAFGSRAASLRLMLSRCELLTNDGLERLRGFSHLEILSLNGCRRVTDAGLAHLHALTALQSLYLVGCSRVTNVGLERLRTALPACEILVG